MYGFGSDKMLTAMKEINNRAKFLEKYKQVVRLLGDFYLRKGYIALTRPEEKKDPVNKEKIDYVKFVKKAWKEGSKVGQALRDGEDVDLTSIKNTLVKKTKSNDHAFMEIWTAASLNHKYARFLLAIFLENGLIPNTKILTNLMTSG
jgi:hypothetical protein